MSEVIGDRVESHAIAEYKALTVTGALGWIVPRQSVFVIGYMRGYIQAQDDYLQKIREAKL